MGEKKSSNASCDIFSKGIFRGFGDEESSPSDIEIEGHEEKYSEKAKLFSDNRKDKIPFHFWEISKFLYGLSESKTEESTASYGDKTLLRLKIDSFISNGIFIICEKIIHPIGDVRERIPIGWSTMFPKSVDRECKYHKYSKRSQEMFDISSSDKKHNNDEWRTDKYRTEIWLKNQEKHDDSENEHIRNESIEKISDL